MEYRCIECRGDATLRCKCVEPNLTYCQRCYSSHMTAGRSHLVENIGEIKDLGPKLRDLSRLFNVLEKQREATHTCMTTLEEIMRQTEIWGQSQMRIAEDAVQAIDKCIARVQDLEKHEEFQQNNLLEWVAARLDDFQDPALDRMIKLLSFSIDHSLINSIPNCVVIEQLQSPLNRPSADAFPSSNLRPAASKDERQVPLSPERSAQLELEVTRLRKENKRLQGEIKTIEQERSRVETEKQISRENTSTLIIQREKTDKEQKDLLEELHKLQKQLGNEQQRAEKEKKLHLEEIEKLKKNVQELEQRKRTIEQELRTSTHPISEETIVQAVQQSPKTAAPAARSSSTPQQQWKCSKCLNTNKSRDQWTNAAAAQWPDLREMIPDFCSKQCFEEFAGVALKREPSGSFLTRWFH